VDSADIGNEEAKVDIGRLVLVIDRIGAIQHDKPPTRVTLKPILDGCHRIGYLDDLGTRSWTAVNQ